MIKREKRRFTLLLQQASLVLNYLTKFVTNTESIKSIFNLFIMWLVIINKQAFTYLFKKSQIE